MPLTTHAARAADRALRTDLAVLLAVRGYEGMASAWRHDPEATVLTVRFLGKPAVVVRGEAGARTFYDTERFARTGAVPAVIAQPLFGRGAVHGLDGDRHRFRKAMFLDVLDHSSVAALAQRTSGAWRRTVSSWEAGSRHDVFAEAVTALGRGAFEWSGSPVRPDDLDAWARDLAGIVDGFGSLGPRQALRRRLARRRSEVWARRSILAARTQPDDAPLTPVRRLAVARDERGRRLDVRTAGVELLNLVRPTVAVAWFVAFAAQALAEHRDLRPRLATATGSDADRVALAHELRRLCPFVPALAAVARQDVELGPGGPTVHRGERLVLDVYGTDHLPSRYPRPGVLHPDRFREQPPGLYDLVPQGGGDPAHGHRCPGEPVTVLLLADAARTLADLDADLDGPAGYGLRTMPTRPRHGPRLLVRSRLRETGPGGSTHPADPTDPAPSGVAASTLPEETVPPPQPDPSTAPHVDRHPDPLLGGAPDDAAVLNAVAVDHRRVLDALDRVQRDPAPTDPLAPALWLLAVHDALHHELFPLVAGDDAARRAVAASLAECALLQQQTEQLQAVSPADGVDLVQAGLVAETAESHFRAQTDVELPALLPHLDAAGRTVLVEALGQVPPATTGLEGYGALSASARARIRATWVRPTPPLASS